MENVFVKKMMMEQCEKFMLPSKFFRNTVFFFFFLLGFSLPAGAVQYWGDGVFADFGFSAKASSLSTAPYEGTVGIRTTFDNAALFAGFCVDNFGFVVAGSAQVLPLKIDFFSLGIKYYTNLSRSFLFEDNPDLVTWGNVMLVSTSFFLGKDKLNPFVIDFNTGVNVNKSFLRLTSNTLTLQEFSLSLELQLRKRFLNRHEMMFRWATFDAFHFKDFVNLWWQLGYSFDINKDFSLGGLAEVVYTDQVFLSGAMSGIQAKVFGVYKL